ncbi:MAG: hypothetical protein IPN78_00005 [Candidatus Accumulibacter sp.]|nr:hypothetical protein [Candidatus Accumulibacter propinquus]
MAISEYSQGDYVIQIDADTVTLSEMAEVKGDCRSHLVLRCNGRRLATGFLR